MTSHKKQDRKKMTVGPNLYATADGRFAEFSFATLTIELSPAFTTPVNRQSVHAREALRSV